MNAILIDPIKKTIESIVITNLADVARVIGYDTLESDEVGTDGDRIYFDENCFIRGTEGRFKIGSLVPLAGKGVLVGTKDDSETLIDVAIKMDDLRELIAYL